VIFVLEEIEDGVVDAKRRLKIFSEKWDFFLFSTNNPPHLYTN